MKSHDLANRHVGPALVAAAVLCLGALALHGPARADVDVRLDLGHAPRLSSFYFTAPPHRVYDASSGVYVVDDPDVGDMDAFQYGGYYWVFRDGFWYRSSDWRGGFDVVQPQYVPTQLYGVPADRWKHHPAYDSWHYRGWHTRDWQDRNNLSTTRDREWNDNGRTDYRAPMPTRTQNGYYQSRYDRMRDVRMRATWRRRHMHASDRDRNGNDSGSRSY